MTEIYTNDPVKINKMVEKNAWMKETSEDISKLSYNGDTIVVPTAKIRDIMPSGYGNERTIESLTGIGFGLAVNSAKGTSSYGAKLSQTKEEKKYYSLKSEKLLSD